MAESLFQEADQMGIFKEQGVDYGAALKRIDEELKKPREAKLPKNSSEEDENDDLYNQECTLEEQEDEQAMSPYETEYNEVISCMS
jgi:hypothetical protein